MLISLAITHIFYITCIYAQENPKTFFRVPPPASQAQLYIDNRIYFVGDTLNVQWITDLKSYRVCLWQQNVQKVAAEPSRIDIFTKTTNQAEPGGFAWKVSPNEFDLSISYIFFLTMGPFASLNNATTSHYFNMTYPVAGGDASIISTLTSRSSMFTSLATQSATSGTTMLPSSSVSASDTSVPAQSIALPVGLGVGLGVPLVALIAFVVFQKNKHNTTHLDSAESPYRSNGSTPGMNTSQPMVGELAAFSKQPVNDTKIMSMLYPQPVEMYAP